MQVHCNEVRRLRVEGLCSRIFGSMLHALAMGDVGAARLFRALVRGKGITDAMHAKIAQAAPCGPVTCKQVTALREQGPETTNELEFQAGMAAVRVSRCGKAVNMELCWPSDPCQTGAWQRLLLEAAGAGALALQCAEVPTLRDARQYHALQSPANAGEILLGFA